ncbi:MAG: lysophospholipase [Chloroflexota bacterium]
MKYSEFQLTTTDNITLQAKLWETENDPKAIVCLIHGFGEHSGRYNHVAKGFVDAGYTVLGMDSRGHGKSTGRRGFIPSYGQFVEDVDVLLETAAEKFPNKTRFLYGHSTGGGLVLRHVFERHPDIAGVIASSPWLRLARDPGFLSRMIMHIFSLFRPQFTIDAGHTPGLLSRDPEVDKIFVADPLNHSKMTAGLLTGGIGNGEMLIKQAADFPEIPLLILHGTGDKIINYKGSQMFASKAPADTLTFITYEDGTHELHNDICKEEVIAAMAEWLQKQTSQIAQTL